MLHSIKRWLGKRPAPPLWPAVSAWAQAAGREFRRTREGDGFVVEEALPLAWRMEWGPSQRRYIQGQELRLRASLQGGRDLQMLLVSRQLMEALEKEVFESFTDSLQTRVDSDTPEEMRWLVMLQKPASGDLKGLRNSFGAVASYPPALTQWLEGALAEKLAQARDSWLGEDEPLVIIVQRGRVTLRGAMAVPAVERLDAVIGLFEVALRELRRVASTDFSVTGPSTAHDSLWSGSVVDTQTPTEK